MEIKSNNIELVAIEKLIPNPKNRNQHTEPQIDRLAEIIQYQGFRVPLIVSNRSGYMVSGHGRLFAARKLGLTHLPVIFQDFDSEEQEYAAGISDNSIASWSELDLTSINAEIGDLGPEFNLDLLGIEDFTLDVSEKSNIDPDIEFTKEINEKNDYIVLLFNDKEKFNQCCDLLEIDRVNIHVSGSKNESFITQGTGRIIDGEKIIPRIHNSKPII
jgi:hypothetical protein